MFTKPLDEEFVNALDLIAILRAMGGVREHSRDASLRASKSVSIEAVPRHEPDVRVFDCEMDPDIAPRPRRVLRKGDNLSNFKLLRRQF